MTKKYFHLLTVFLLIQSVTFAQDQSVQKIIITTPGSVTIDKKARKKLDKYEEACILPLREYLYNSYDSLLQADSLAEFEKLHIEGLRNISPELSIKTEIAYKLAQSSQGYANYKKSNQAYVPLIYEGEYTLSALERLATKESADFILFIDSVTCTKERGKIIIDPSPNLYDNILKRIVYPDSKMTVGDNVLSTSTCSSGKNEFTIVTTESYDLSQIYNLLSKSNRQYRTALSQKREYLTNIYNDSAYQNSIRTALKTSIDSSKLKSFYRGIYNEEKNKFVAISIWYSKSQLGDLDLPSYFIIIYPGTLVNGKWVIEKSSGSAYISKGDSEEVKQEIFFRLEKSKLFIKNTDKLNPDFWTEEYLKIRLMP